MDACADVIAPRSANGQIQSKHEDDCSIKMLGEHSWEDMPLGPREIRLAAYERCNTHHSHVGFKKCRGEGNRGKNPDPKA